ncbi:MAG: hypothetical protein JNM34_06430 [Chthonomonadaceae bacterium]|nr:hypothetical protein [Chthonomonadaceae bacterium]
MTHFSPRFTRRRFLGNVSSGIVSAPVLAAFAEEHLRWIESGDYADDLERTPALEEGPYYPDKLPLDRDNDLLVIGAGDQALGEVTHLFGRILDTSGKPMKGLTVEIWQTDLHGAYIHSKSINSYNRDKLFQGFGQFETGKDGSYKFRTIKPVPYLFRAPHVHYKIKKGDRELLTTQCLVAGHEKLDRDIVLRTLKDPKLRELVLAKYVPKKGSKTGELQAKFDIVLGATPEA